MQHILFPEQNACRELGAAGEISLAAHGHGVAVRADALVGKEVGRVAQCRGVNGLIRIRAAPQAVFALADKVKVGNLARNGDLARLGRLGKGIVRDGDLRRFNFLDVHTFVVLLFGAAGNLHRVPGLEERR